MALKRSPLDPQKILALLHSDGPISSKLKHFEVRPSQMEMLATLIEAFNKNAIALIEAGTGTGKSMAYLIPSLLAATIWKERVVISTHTIALQEQLLKKDLPLLMDALGITLKAVLMKGMGNYVCLRKIEEMAFEKHLVSPSEQETLAHIENLSGQGIGAKGDFPFSPPPHLWEMVAAEYETCNGADCPHFHKCYYMNARKNAQDAQLLIVNHHLLFADLVIRADEEKKALLPDYSRLIIDEAHHLEDIATEYFADKVSRLDLLKTLSKISSEKQGKAQGRLPLIKEMVVQMGQRAPQLMNRLNLELPTLKRDVIKEIADTFHLLDQFQKGENESEESKVRLRPHHYEGELWNAIGQKLNDLHYILKRFSAELFSVERNIADLNNEKVLEATKGPLYDLKNMATQLETEADYIKAFASPTPVQESIRWLESHMAQSGLNISCIDARLDISQLLAKYLFSPFETVALLSATLTTKGSFDYMKEEMGLTDTKRTLIEASYPSPFDFEKQALLIVPKDIPVPSNSQFLPQAEMLIEEALLASRGNAFILFTSYEMLRTCYEHLYEKLIAHRFFPLKQGEESRGALLERFIKQDRSVLFGTNSFWEGVDVVGEALRLVIIAKLPFKVPTDPLIEAKSEALLAQGKNPFLDLLLPQAAIKFKQGFGRLIRNKKDRGCIVCLDNRLVKKSYGQYFLKSLPKCPLEVVENDRLRPVMEEFYRSTYYLTK